MSLTNLASSPLNGGINDSTTTIVVDDGSVFPTSNFYCIVEDEIVYCSSRTTNTLTVTRGQEGTTGASHADDSLIKLTLTAATVDDEWELFKFGAYTSRPSAGKEGLQYFANDIDLGWRDNGTNWDLIHPVYVPYANRVDVSSWTALNQGSSVWTDQQGTLDIEMPGNAGNNARGFYKSVPTAPYVINAIVRPLQNSLADQEIGLMLTNATAMKTFGYLNQSLFHRTRATVTTNPTNNINYLVPNPQYLWLRIQDDNTNVMSFCSFDGLHYNKLFSQTRTTTFTATHVGIFANRSENTWPSVTHCQVLAYWET